MNYPTSFRKTIATHKQSKSYNDKIFSLYSSADPDKIRDLKNTIFTKINSIAKDKILFKEATSEHYDLFNCLSFSDRKILKILEIGTFRGYTAAYLAYLFPNANVYSIDLPADSPEYINTYGRESSVNDFVVKRNFLLNSFNNIRFFDIPSTSFLFNHSQQFDLIWIDGDHSYPQVCIDIVSSLHLLADNGVIMIDDIYRDNIDLPENHLKSRAAFETIENLCAAKIVSRDYIFKRTILIKNTQGDFVRPEPFVKSVAILTKVASNISF